MFEQLLMKFSCVGPYCGPMLLQDVMIMLTAVICGCAGLLVAYRKFLRKDASGGVVNENE